MMLTEPVGAHMSEANVKAAAAAGRNQFGHPLFDIE
jgi:hypothetical protein